MFSLWSSSPCSPRLIRSFLRCFLQDFSNHFQAFPRKAAWLPTRRPTSDRAISKTISSRSEVPTCSGEQVQGPYLVWSAGWLTDSSPDQLTDWRASRLKAPREGLQVSLFAFVCKSVEPSVGMDEKKHSRQNRIKNKSPLTSMLKERNSSNLFQTRWWPLLSEEHKNPSKEMVPRRNRRHSRKKNRKNSRIPYSSRRLPGSNGAFWHLWSTCSVIYNRLGILR